MSLAFTPVTVNAAYRTELNAIEVPAGILAEPFFATHNGRANNYGGIGTVIALWCIFAFVFVGKGTPAPIDPPRRLVVRGPYRFVRNPMYIAAGLALVGLAIFYESILVALYAGLFLLAAHIFVVAYEEPTLRQTFGQEYDGYCVRVRRWWPAGDHRSLNAGALKR